MSVRTVEPVRVAVIGLGHMGSIHARLLSGLVGAELRVCCDVDPGRIRSCPDGARFTTDYEDALSDQGLEAVVVATPDDRHRDLTIAALERGYAVLCEKPLATTLIDADAMIAAAEATGASLTVGHVLRFDPRYATVKQAHEDRLLGEPVHLVGRNNSALSEAKRLAGRTNLALYVGVHVVDVMRWLAGDIVKVHAEGSAFEVAGEFASVVATLRFRCGAVGVVELSWGLPESAGVPTGEHAFAYVGTKACAYVSIHDHGVQILGSADAAPGTRTFEFPDASFRPETHGIAGGPFRAQLESFLHLARAGGSPVVSAADGRAALETALAIDKSARSGRPVELRALADSRSSRGLAGRR